MLTRDRIRTVLALGLPIVGGMLSQNVLNVVDTAMVGALGDVALAATGQGSFLNFMAVAFVTGLSSGVQAMAARRKGEGRDDETAVPLNGGLLLATAIALPASIVLVGFAPELFALVNDDPAVIDAGAPYLQARLCAMVAAGANFAFRGYWNGVGRSTVYLRTLIAMHAVNIFLNWVFIQGNLGAPALGAAGAGVASAIATWVGTIAYTLQGLTLARGAGFLRGLPDLSTVRSMLRLSVPSGVQQLFFAGGFTVIFWIVAQVGTSELAAANVLITLTLVVILPGMGLGLAAASLVGQALGRGDVDDARAWGWDVVKLAVGTLVLIGLPGLLAPDLVLGGFIHEADTLALARGPLMLLAATIGLEGVGMVLLNALLGAGDNRRVMVVSVGSQWLIGIPLAWLLGPGLGYGLMGIWVAQVAYRVLWAVIFAAMWRGRGWTRIQV
ncbi:MAG: MATE family efflux transporter [Alphaproteobacteria bacterium]|nr:MATE family efflux transporter [Alphaproteobacteria bacterium]